MKRDFHARDFAPLVWVQPIKWCAFWIGYWRGRWSNE